MKHDCPACRVKPKGEPRALKDAVKAHREGMSTATPKWLRPGPANRRAARKQLSLGDK